MTLVECENVAKSSKLLEVVYYLADLLDQFFVRDEFVRWNHRDVFRPKRIDKLNYPQLLHSHFFLTFISKISLVICFRKVFVSYHRFTLAVATAVVYLSYNLLPLLESWKPLRWSWAALIKRIWAALILSLRQMPYNGTTAKFRPISTTHIWSAFDCSRDTVYENAFIDSQSSFLKMHLSSNDT